MSKLLLKTLIILVLAAAVFGSAGYYAYELFVRPQKALQAENIVAGGGVPAGDRPEWRTWTDDYSNLVQILK